MAPSYNQYPIFRSGYREPVSYCSTSPKIAAVLACAFIVGTGGLMTQDYFQHRGERGYPSMQIRFAPANLKMGIRRPDENLERIRAVFKPSVSDVANMLGVSRQTVYNWMAGESPSLESTNRLEDIANAADHVAANGLATSAYLLKRKIRDGKALLDIVRDGGSAQDAAKVLVRIDQNEASQRALLQGKLAGRQFAKPDISDFGVPMLNEHIES